MTDLDFSAYRIKISTHQWNGWADGKEHTVNPADYGFTVRYFRKAVSNAAKSRQRSSRTRTDGTLVTFVMVK